MGGRVPLAPQSPGGYCLGHLIRTAEEVGKNHCFLLESLEAPEGLIVDLKISHWCS